MPGTIHVSVLELVGLPSPPPSSSMGVKVSMGKQAREMHDKDETSFPLASLRDNLNVSIHDFEGNEIAHTDVETRSIVEKVTWDDVFLLNGGGKIHMRIHFILSEDEQNRIRNMRESAARKKHEDLLKRRHSSSELASASSASLQHPLKFRHETEGRSVDLSDSEANNISAESNVKSLEKAQPDQKRKQAFSTSKSAGSLHNLAAYQQLEERDQGQDVEQQFQLDKTSSDVRKVILAFEKSPVEDKSPATYNTRATAQTRSSTLVGIPSRPPSLKKTAAVSSKSVLFKSETLHTPEGIGKERENVLLDTNKTMETSQLGSTTRVDTLSNVPILKKSVFNTIPAKEEHKEEKSSLNKLPERSMLSLKKLLGSLPKRTGELPTVLLNRKIGIEKKWRSKQWKSSEHRAKPKLYYENEHHTIDRWIFLDDMIGSCVLSGDNPSIDLHEGCLSECKQDNDQEKLTDSGVTQSKSEKDSIGSKKLESNRRRPNNASFTGSAGQVVKIVIMVGFGFLVFLTRQRK